MKYTAWPYLSRTYAIIHYIIYNVHVKSATATEPGICTLYSQYSGCKSIVNHLQSSHSCVTVYRFLVLLTEIFHTIPFRDLSLSIFNILFTVASYAHLGNAHLVLGLEADNMAILSPRAMKNILL